MDWGAVATVAVGVLSALGPAAAISRRARLRARLRQTTELLKELPESGQDELRSALREVADVCGKKLARIELSWADLQRDTRKRVLRTLVLLTGWQGLLIAALMAAFRTQLQPSLGWPSWAYWWGVVNSALLGAAMVSAAYDPRVLATFSSEARRAPAATPETEAESPA